MKKKKKKVFILLLFLMVVLIFLTDFGCKDKSYEETKEFYYGYKQELNIFAERIRTESDLMGVLTTDPGFGFFSCNQPFKIVRISGYKDDYNIPIVYSVSDFISSIGLNKWCIENNLDFDLIVELSDFAAQNNLDFIGKENISTKNIKIIMSIRTHLLNIPDSADIKYFEKRSRTFKHIEGNWYYVNTFE